MITQRILEILKMAERPTYIILNILMGGFNYKRIKRKAFYPTLPDFNSPETHEIIKTKNKNKFYSLLSRLKKQGFIEKKIKQSKIYWKLTSKGEKRLENLKNALKFPKLFYKQEKDNRLNIVIFDIPEKYRRKRNWLRNNLLALGFTILQKSVWIGKNKIPKDFLKAMTELEIIDFIHIFKISKTGTIRELNF